LNLFNALLEAGIKSGAGGHPRGAAIAIDHQLKC
jgi:hypothetical protein